MTKSAGLVLAFSTGWFSETLPGTDCDRDRLGPLEGDGCTGMVRVCKLQLSGTHLVYMLLCRVTGTMLAAAPP